MEKGKRELTELLSHPLGDKAEGVASELFERFGNLCDILQTDKDALAELTGNSVALLLKLVACLHSRRVCDGFEFMKVHTEEEIKRYFSALFFGESSERVYLMSLDSDGRVTDCRVVGGGTVNSAGVYPRKLLEAAILTKARSVILAHNHPTGDAAASGEDINLSLSLYEMFSVGGIDLVEHYVVSRDECRPMRLSSMVER